MLYDLEDFSNFGNELLKLPFSFVGKPPSSRFTMMSVSGDRAPWSSCGGKVTGIGQEEGSGTGRFQYYGREAFKAIYGGETSLRIRGGYPMYYLHGTLGFGKSYIFAVVLIRGKKRVVYLPGCRGFVREVAFSQQPIVT